MIDDVRTLLAAPPQAGFLAALGLRLTVITGDRVEAELDATAEHHTPWGVVHGGVYATVVESVTSLGASAAVQDRGQFAVGLDNLTDFVRAHRTGLLRAVALPVHQGRTGQLWTAEITREDGAVVATGRVRLHNVDLPG